MTVFFNGSFVDEHEAKIPVTDRGFLYGDGLFETLRIYSGKAFRFTEHWERLERGAKFLKIAVPYTLNAVRKFADELVERNHLPGAVLRITLSRGSGKRGYSIIGTNTPTFVMSLHPLPTNIPAALSLHTASFRIPKNGPLSAFKTANKLHNILAKAEAEEHGADEALMLNPVSEVAQVSSGNIFWIIDGTVHTPPIESGILPGVTRGAIIELLRKASIPCQESVIEESELFGCDGCFITNSVVEILPISHFGGQIFKSSPLISEIRAKFQSLIEEETNVNSIEN